MQTATEKSKAAIAAIANGAVVPDTEMTRHIWLASGNLVTFAKNAEHAAFLAMRELETNQAQSAYDFNRIMIQHLSELKITLVHIGSIINGK